jgi:exopolysaccharide production protein ExoQ
MTAIARGRGAGANRMAASAAPAPTLSQTAVPLWERALAVYCIFHYSDGLWGTLFADPTAVDESPMLRLLWYPVYLLGLLGLMRIWREASKQLLGAMLLVGLLVYTFISTGWSIQPDVTFRRSIALLMTTLFGVYLATRYDWRSLVLLFAASFGIMAIVGFIGSLLAPKLFVHKLEYAGAWKGVWRHKNQMGSLMARGVMACVCAAVLMPQRRRMWWAAAAFCFVMVLLSQSITSVLATIVGLTVIAIFWTASKGALSGYTFAYCLLMIGLAALAAVLFAPEALFQMAGRDSTLTGRAGIWMLVEQEIDKAPVFGHGYQSFWQGLHGPAAHIRQALWFNVPHSHNSWLELMLDLGYFGAIGVGAYFALTTARTLTKFKEPMIGAFALATLSATFLFSLSETVLWLPNSYLQAMLVAIAIKLSTEANARRTAAIFKPTRSYRSRSAQHY